MTRDEQQIIHMQRWIIALGGRRCIMSGFLLLVFIPLLCFDKLSQDKYENLTMAVLLIYVGGNVIQKATEKRQENEPDNNP